MDKAVVSLSRIREKGAWHFPLFSTEVREAQTILDRSPYPHIPLGDLVKKTARGFPQIGVDRSEDAYIPLLSTASISSEGITIEKSRKYITSEEHEKLIQSAVQRNDVLVTLSISSKERIAAVYDSDEPANLTPHVALLRVRESKIDPRYLVAFLNSSLGQSLITHMATGSIQRSLAMSRLMDLPIPLPALSEQKTLVQAVQEKQSQAAQKEREAAKLRKEANEVVVAFLQGEE